MRSFTLLTMGLNLILLGLFAKANEKIQTFFYPLVVFGQAPLFFYIVHLFLYAGLGMWLAPEGTSIAAMYPYWLLGLLLLFPVCLMYGRLKHRPPVNTVLRYLQLGFRQGDNKNEVGTLCGILWNSYLSNISGM